MPRSNARQRARNLRNNSTDAERYLWRHLRRRNIEGVKFRRQVPLGPYVVDFISLEVGLIVEIDGGQHTEMIAQDARRDKWLKKQGYRILRFWNNEVFLETDSVLSEIMQMCLTPTLTLPRQGGGDQGAQR